MNYGAPLPDGRSGGGGRMSLVGLDGGGFFVVFSVFCVVMGWERIHRLKTV